MAVRTRHTRFSTHICLLPFHNPVRLAEDLAVLDNLSGGRAGASKLTEQSSSIVLYLGKVIRAGRTVAMAPLTELPAQQTWQADDELTKPLRK